MGLPTVTTVKKKKPKPKSDSNSIVEQERVRGSRFADHLPTLLQDEYDMEARSKAAKHAALEMVMSLIPAAEQRVRESGSSQGIYQLLSLLGTMREFLTDLDGERDLAVMVQLILDNVVTSKLMTFGQLITQGQAHLKRTLRTELPPEQYKIVEEEVNAYLTSLADYVKNMNRDIQQSVSDALKGNIK